VNFSGALTRTAKSSEFFLRKNAPTILTGAGVAGFIATTVLTIRATAKAVDELPRISREIAKAKSVVVPDEATEKEKMERLIQVYMRESLVMGRIYGPALTAGSLSIVCVISAHNMMLKRQATLLAAYTAMDTAYKAYRKRVAEKIGAEEELKLYRGVKTMKNRDEDGNELDACQIDFDDVHPSPYARFFDESSPNWTKTPEYNLMFLRAQQDWANNRLRSCGYVFLNEVYESLGLERSQAGQIVGWKEGDGDGFVDFGLYAIGDECNRAFVNGIEHTVLLDFNVDGPITI
jgi:hypothetical protein